MAARDIFHYQVRRALEKEGWVITDGPLKVEMPGAKLKIDLGAEQMLGRNVPVKKSRSKSPVLPVSQYNHLVEPVPRIEG